MKAAPEAMTPTTLLGKRFPNSPLMTNPIAGKIGISQIRSKKFISVFSVSLCCVLVSPLHEIDLVDVHGFLVLEHRDHDPEPHRGFGRGDGDDKDSEDLP